MVAWYHQVKMPSVRQNRAIGRSKDPGDGGWDEYQCGGRNLPTPIEIRLIFGRAISPGTDGPAEESRRLRT
jgi:hypothetical protein